MVRAPFLDGGGEFLQKGMGFRPVNAGVGDALSIDQRGAGDQLLRSGDEIAFDHDTHDATFSAGDLL